MKRRRKFLTILISVFVSICVLAACGDSTEPVPNSASQPVPSSGSETKEAVVLDKTKATPALLKEEDVLVKADATGTPKEVSVSAVLKSTGSSAVVLDESNLTEIINKEGDEEYQQTGSELLWENSGADILYEGKSADVPSVSVKITYYLDGKAMRPEEIAGKSGSVKIRFDYSDTESKDKRLPYLFLSVAALDGEHFSNIEVTNGASSEIGDMKLVIGYAVPGLKESLGLSQLDIARGISFPEYVEITADAKDFKLDYTTTVVSPGLLEDIDTNQLKDGSDLADSFQSLKAASSEILNGISTLNSGAGTFANALKQYTDGAAQLHEGVNALGSGLNTLKTNEAALSDGAEQLASGLSELNEKVSALDVDAMAYSIRESLAALLKDEAFESKLDYTTLKELLTPIIENWSTIQPALQILSEAVSAAGLDLQALDEQLIQLDAEIKRLREEGVDTTKAEELLKNIFERLQSAIDHLSEIQLPGVDQTDVDNLQQALQEELDRLQKILDLLKSLENFPDLTDLKTQVEELKNGVSALADGAGQLKEGIALYTSGVSALNEGSAQLKEGSSRLSSSGSELNAGYGTLQEGIGTLLKSYSAFDSQGIQKLSALGGNDLKNVVSQIKRLQALEKESHTFSGCAEGTTCSVRYIIETDGVTEK